VARQAQCGAAQLTRQHLDGISRVRGMATNAGQSWVAMVCGVHIDFGGPLEEACRHVQSLAFGVLRRGNRSVAGGAERVHIRPQMHAEIRAVGIVADGAVGACRIVHKLFVSWLVRVARDAKVDHPGFQQLRLRAGVRPVAGNTRVVV